MATMDFNAEAPKLDEKQKFDLVCKWYEAKQELAAMQAKERLLRDSVFAEYFPDPKEGTNNVTLGTGDVLTAVYPMNRKIDKAVFSGLQEALREANVDTDQVIETKLELKVGAYRKLSEEQLKVMDQCITMTPGSPQVSIKIKG